MIYRWPLRLSWTLSFIGAWWCSRSSSGPAIQFGQIVLKHTGTERNMVRAHGRCTWESGKFFRGESAAAWVSAVYTTTAFCLIGYFVYLPVFVCLFVCLLSKRLFTLRWGTPVRWGNQLRWGNPPVHSLSFWFDHPTGNHLSRGQIFACKRFEVG